MRYHVKYVVHTEGQADRPFVCTIDFAVSEEDALRQAQSHVRGEWGLERVTIGAITKVGESLFSRRV